MAGLYPGMTEAEGTFCIESVLFHLMPSQTFVYAFATGAAMGETEKEFGFPRKSISKLSGNYKPNLLMLYLDCDIIRQKLFGCFLIVLNLYHMCAVLVLNSIRTLTCFKIYC